MGVWDLHLSGSLMRAELMHVESCRPAGRMWILDLHLTCSLTRAEFMHLIRVWDFGHLTCSLTRAELMHPESCRPAGRMGVWVLEHLIHAESMGSVELSC